MEQGPALCPAVAVAGAAGGLYENAAERGSGGAVIHSFRRARAALHVSARASSGVRCRQSADRPAGSISSASASRGTVCGNAIDTGYAADPSRWGRAHAIVGLPRLNEQEAGSGRAPSAACTPLTQGPWVLLPARPPSWNHGRAQVIGELSAGGAGGGAQFSELSE